MKRNYLIIGIALFLAVIVIQKPVFSQNKTAKEIITAADKKMQGESNRGTLTMKIIRTTWEREVKFKTWGKGREYSITLITYPAKEKGQSFLKRGNEMWSWNPVIGRMIKLPPSMMSQGWMGSDYSTDDILKESSIIVDYNHSIIGVDTIEGIACWKIQLLPKEDAAVVWGKLIKWISKDEYLQLKTEYYDEDDYLVKTERASKIKKMGDREIPTYIEIIPEDEPGNKTIVIIDNVEFNVSIPDNFFSKQNMKRLR